MKDFWSENSSIVGKLYLNQFGAAFLGMTIHLAAFAAQSIKFTMLLLASGLSIAFYLYLIYSVMWEKGGRDRIKVDSGRAKKNILTGLYITLLQNIPNLIIALIVLIGYPLKESALWVHTLGRGLSLMWESMYAGLVANFSPHNPIAHLLIVLPAIAVGSFAYYIGYSNKRLLSVFSLRPAKK